MDFNGGPPTAARFAVDADNGSITITPHVPGLPVVPVEGLQMAVEALAFSWSPSSSIYECLLDSHGGDRYQGSCTSAAGDTWDIHLLPPGSAPAALADHALNHESFRWIRLAIDHVDLYFLTDSYSFERRRTHGFHAEQARERALQILGERDYERRISVFYLDSLANMAELFGEPVPSKTDPFGDALALVLDGEVALRERHELMQVLSWGVWGIAVDPYRWISEGLAIYAQGGCQGHDLHHLARSLNRSDALLPIDTLIHGFRQQEKAIANVQAGSFVRYIHEQHGVRVLRVIWQRGIAQLSEQTGLSLAQLDTEWRQYITAVSDDPLVARWQPERGCRF